MNYKVFVSFPFLTFSSENTQTKSRFHVFSAFPLTFLFNSMMCRSTSVGRPVVHVPGSCSWTEGDGVMEHV